MSRPVAPPPSTQEKGAALISALLLVALMTTVALAIATDMRFSMRRAANLDIRDQSYWYALGARDFAESMVERAMGSPEEALTPSAAWLSGPQIFPIEDGQLAGTIRDGNNCFNVNSLVVAGGNGLLVEDPQQRRRFERLMDAAGIPLNVAALIAGQAVDWIDSDARPVVSGGEDEIYAEGERGYRTANTLMVERQELLSLAAMTPALYERIAPLVCTRPVAEPLPLNINTLRFDQAPLMMAAFDGRLSRTDVEGLLIQRPQDGYGEIAEFWALPAIQALEPDAAMQSVLATTTNYFEIEIDVFYAGMRFELFELIEWRGGGDVRRVSQRYGSFS